MEVQLKKWGNSLGLRIPAPLVASFGFGENVTVELREVDGALVIRKKEPVLTLEFLLASVPADFSYPADVADFVGEGPVGQELI